MISAHHQQANLLRHLLRESGGVDSVELKEVPHVGSNLTGYMVIARKGDASAQTGFNGVMSCDMAELAAEIVAGLSAKLAEPVKTPKPKAKKAAAKKKAK